MTRKGTRAVIVATTACALTVAASIVAVVDRPVNGGGNYAVLSVSETVVDRDAVAALAAAGIGGVVSESTQWVYMDSFDGLEKIPLDRYRDRIETFDPRDDGYADRVRSLFVGAGRRRLYIPDASASRLRVISALFPDAEYAVASPPAGASIVDLVLCVVAALVAVFLCGAPRVLAAAIPAFVSFAPFGGAALAAAGLFAAALHTTADTAREALRSWRGARALRDRPWLLDGLPPAFFCLVGAAAACAFGGVPPVAAVLSFSAGFAAVVAGIYYQELRRSERGHPRFSPVNLYRRTGTLAASRTAVPFAAAALVSVFLALSGLGSSKVSTQAPLIAQPAVTEEDYRSHLEFQRAFSVSKLSAAESPSYGRYRLGPDGLVMAGSEQDYGRDSGKLELPPAERMLTHAAPAVATPRSAVGPLASLAAVFAVAFPALAQALRKRQRVKGLESLADKRIAA